MHRLLTRSFATPARARSVHVRPYWERPGKDQKVAVFGAGSFGMAMAAVASRNGYDGQYRTRILAHFI